MVACVPAAGHFDWNKRATVRNIEPVKMTEKYRLSARHMKMNLSDNPHLFVPPRLVPLLLVYTFSRSVSFIFTPSSYNDVKMSGLTRYHPRLYMIIYTSLNAICLSGSLSCLVFSIYYFFLRRLWAYLVAGQDSLPVGQSQFF